MISYETSQELLMIANTDKILKKEHQGGPNKIDTMKNLIIIFPN